MNLTYNQEDEKTLEDARNLLSEMQKYKLNMYKNMGLDGRKLSMSMINDKDIRNLLNTICEIKKVMMPIGLVIKNKKGLT